jgi:CheY-like chemotaxis protein
MSNTVPLNKPFEPSDLKHVLVVDDEGSNRTALKWMLAAMGVEKVTTAINGEDALQKLRAEKPDLVITDGNMPKMDGFGLTRAIRADAALSSLPVVFMSAMQGNKREALAAGADAFVEKTVDPLDAGIKQALTLRPPA